MSYELTDIFLLLVAGVIAIAFLGMFIMKFILSVYFPFVDEYDRIKHKIMFSMTSKERAYWIREKRRLYISYIPVVGGFIARRIGKKKKDINR